MTILPSNSDVVLHVPDGVCGILLGNIEIDLSQFAHLVRQKECIVGPVCDLHVEYIKYIKADRKPFRLQIPHILDESELATSQIRVQIWEKSSQKITNALPVDMRQDILPAIQQSKPLFLVNNSCVEVFKQHFSAIIISAEAASCLCWKRLNLLVFSRMDPPNPSFPVANMEIYLTAVMSTWQDVLKVCKPHH